MCTDVADIEIVTEEWTIYNSYPSGTEGPKLPDLTFGKDASSYQLVSVPAVLKNGLVSSVFKDFGSYNSKKWRVFGMKNGNVVEYDAPGSIVEFGKSYWLIAKNETVVYPGEANTPLVTEALRQNWISHQAGT